MQPRDIITIGASAGGVEALRSIVSGFPPDLEGAIFVVLHIGNRRSNLPEILSRAGPLRAIHPLNNSPIVKGTIYVAPPDCHMTVERDRICLSRGPKENRTRPAINPLFRSAAWSFGTRVTGVILTGSLDDGTAGLAEIKRRGGLAVVQDPATASCSSMPKNALKYVDVDYIAEVNEIPSLLADLVKGNGKESQPVRDEKVEKTLSALTCPECRGPLWEERQNRIVEYRCRVGHAYSPLALIQEHHETVERTLWSALVALEEAADIDDRLMESNGELARDAANKRRQIETLKAMLSEQLAVSPE
jgi:two-component system chemotaxis response regulator CheB